MKKSIIIFILTAFIASKSSAQCGSLECTSTYTVPITDVNDFNNHHRGSNCMVGAGTIPTLANFNDWEYYSFDSDDGIMYVSQTLNYGTTAKDVYTFGHVEMSSVNFVGGSSLYANGDSLIISSVTANGFYLTSPNTIYLNETDGTRFFYSGTEYFVGDTIKTVADNPTNKIVITGCESTPLGIIKSDLKGYVKNGFATLTWNVDFDYEFILQAKIDQDWVDISYFNTGSFNYYMLKNTQFRLKVDGQYGKILYLRFQETNTIKKGTYDLEGRKIDKVKVSGIYIVNGVKTYIQCQN